LGIPVSLFANHDLRAVAWQAGVPDGDLMTASADTNPSQSPAVGRGGVVPLTPQETALRLNITTDQLAAFTADGEISYINVGRGKKRPRRRYTEQDIQEFLERRRRREVCLSTATSVPRTTSSISRSTVIGFMAQRNARRAKTP
jgi:hypothetical protein